MTQLFESDKIFVAGHRGLIGQAIVKNLKSRGFNNLLLRTRQELDLFDGAAVHGFFSEHKPDAVFLAAARVGGILANNTYRADFAFENLQIQNNVIWSAHLNDTRRLVFLGSSCVYPRDCEQPMKEAHLLTKPLEETNRPYAVAKIAGLELVNALRRQYGRDYFSVMPTNLYGPGDDFDPNSSHVLPGLIGRFIEAKTHKRSSIQVWGSGSPRREFLYSGDCADAIVYLGVNLEKGFFESPRNAAPGFSHINIGFGEDISIAQLARVIASEVGYEGELVFDRDKPDGTPQKLLDCTMLNSLGWSPKVSLHEGIRLTIEWYLSHEKKLN